MTAVGIRLGNFRDLLAQEDIARKAELGWLNVEFTMYGCAYFDYGKDKMQYRISSRGEDIFEFIENCTAKNITPTGMEKLSLICPVPEGTQGLIGMEIKKELAKQLQSQYSPALFHVLKDFSPNNNGAADVLWQEAERMQGVFQEDTLQAFRDLVEYAFKYHTIDSGEYEKFLRWLEDERKNIYDDVALHSEAEKEMYAMFYREPNGLVKSLTDARKENLLKKITEIELKGGVVSPIYAKTYVLTPALTVASVGRMFREEMKKMQDSPELELIWKIRSVRNEERREEYLAQIEAFRNEMGEKAATVLSWYGYRWGIL